MKSRKRVDLIAFALMAMLVITRVAGSAASPAIVGPPSQSSNTVSSSPVKVSAQAEFRRFQIPTRRADAAYVVSAADGVWFTEQLGNKIGHLSRSGQITEFTVPTRNAEPFGIATGPSGSIWFTERRGGKVGRISSSGRLKEYRAGVGLFGIFEGPDRAMWFTESDGRIGRITMDGVITQFSVPWVKSWPQGITLGPDGALWFADYGTNSVGRLTTEGAFDAFPVAFGVEDIVTGSDGALWVAAPLDEAIFRVTITGQVAKFPTPTNPYGIASGADGALWFSLPLTASGEIGRLSTTGNLTMYSIPVHQHRPYTSPFGIAAAADGAIWFATPNAGEQPGSFQNAIERLTLR